MATQSKNVAKASNLTSNEDLPYAIAAGERTVGGYSIPVFNLSDGQRVLSERGFLAVIGAKGRGASGGHRLIRILSDPIIKPFFSKKTLVAIESPLQFLTESKTLARGYSAEVLKDFCMGFVRAREAKALHTATQLRYASYCQTLILAFAEMGINYWIDEATGYQDSRTRDELHKILEKYIEDEAHRWSKTFPDEFYQEMCRLKGWKFSSDFLTKKPSVVGHYTNDIVYARLAPAVLQVLREKNPVIDTKGNRKRKHHQWLTQDFGHPRLKEHIGNVIFLMKGTTRWDSFYRALQRSAPRLNETPQFDFDDY